MPVATAREPSSESTETAIDVAARSCENDPDRPRVDVVDEPHLSPELRSTERSTLPPLSLQLAERRPKRALSDLLDLSDELVTGWILLDWIGSIALSIPVVFLFGAWELERGPAVLFVPLRIIDNETVTGATSTSPVGQEQQLDQVDTASAVTEFQG